MDEKQKLMDAEQQLRQTRQKQEMLDVLDAYFNAGVDKKKFIDVSRIPLICQDIKVIHSSIEKIDSNVTWVVRLIIGAVLLAGVAMIFK